MLFLSFGFLVRISIIIAGQYIVFIEEIYWYRFALSDNEFQWKAFIGQFYPAQIQCTHL